MKPALWIILLFAVAALYDGVLGFAFLTAPAQLFEWAKVTPPNHFGYVQFPAALLLIFGIMFTTIAIRPFACRSLIPYGILLKVAYCGVAGAYWILTDIPFIWKPFVVIDAVMGVLFVLAYMALAKPAAERVG
jgi:hypothetical protein